jgi:uncharacterized membrane-anchored protein
MRADSQVRLRREPLAAKVPDITASFWVLKLITTAMGEAASDYLLNTISLLGLVIGAAGFAITLWVQFRTRRYNAFAYWSAVMMVAVFGTMAADVIHHQLGVSLPARNPQPGPAKSPNDARCPLDQFDAAA